MESLVAKGAVSARSFFRPKKQGGVTSVTWRPGPRIGSRMLRVDSRKSTLIPARAGIGGTRRRGDDAGRQTVGEPRAGQTEVRRPPPTTFPANTPFKPEFLNAGSRAKTRRPATTTRPATSRRAIARSRPCSAGRACRRRRAACRRGADRPPRKVAGVGPSRPEPPRASRARGRVGERKAGAQGAGARLLRGGCEVAAVARPRKGSRSSAAPARCGALQRSRGPWTAEGSPARARDLTRQSFNVAAVLGPRKGFCRSWTCWGTPYFNVAAVLGPRKGGRRRRAGRAAARLQRSRGPWTAEGAEAIKGEDARFVLQRSRGLWTAEGRSQSSSGSWAGVALT